MTKIKKLQHKRLSFPPQEIQVLREQLEATAVNDIPKVLEGCSDWPFLRGDMYHWIGVLNRFDDIMAGACEEYGLSGFQETPFKSGMQRVLVAVLDFSRLLLESCINRNLYSSVERLEQLLNTSDTEVLEHTLRVIQRTAQRWSYQRDLKSNLAAISSRLIAIADPWNVKKDIPSEVVASGSDSSTVPLALHTNEFRLLASDEHTELLRRYAGVVHYQFFRTAEEARQLESEATSLPSKADYAGSQSKTAERSSSKRAHGPSLVTEGLVSIDMRVFDIAKVDPAGGIYEQMQQAFVWLTGTYRVPAAHHYELRHRIYVALALARGDSSLRLQLLRSRIYAAGVLSLMMSELEFKNTFLSREPGFTADIIGVLQPEAHAPLSVQTAVLLALEGVLKLRGELSGAYVALNASANHGVLMFILRKAFASGGEGDVESPVFPYEFTSALLSFLTAMTNSMNGGQLLVSAGVVPVFVAALRNMHAEHQRSAGRVAKLLDLLVSSATSAFPAFCSANGIDVLVKRIHSEVISAVAASDANPELAADLSSPVALPRFPDSARQVYRRREILSVEHIYVLKELFKLLSHLVAQPGYQDRLRNLVETTLPETLRTVVTHPAAFGGNIYGLAISISATLVHNEPTSLAIIQEARLPQEMLSALEMHIPYNGDAIVHIPAALGAFCLNDVGLEQVRQSRVVHNVLGVFSDPHFVRVLQEGDVPGMFGSVLDEFMRHFPTVRDEVMDEVIEMLRAVGRMGSADSPLRLIDPGNTYLLRAPVPEGDISATAATSAPAFPATAALPDSSGRALQPPSLLPSSVPHHDDYYGMMLESATTFLEGLLEQRTHGKLFMDKGGWELVVQAVRSPLLPFEFAKTRTFKSLHGLSSLLLETSQEKVFSVLLQELKLCLARPMAFTTAADGANDMVRAYVAFANPSALSPAEYDEVHDRLHNTVTTTGITTLITYLINGSGGWALTRSLKDLNTVIELDDFVAILRSATSNYRGSIQAAVAVEAEMAKLPKLPETSTSATIAGSLGSQDMEVDESSAVAVEPFIRTNMQNLAETAVAFTMETGEYIECMSNSLGLDVKDETNGVITKVGPVLSAVLVDFVLDMLKMCHSADKTAAGAQLIDQTMVITMKTLVFARHRIYLKLRILAPFVEQGGMKLFCEILESTWAWAGSLPHAPPPLLPLESAASEAAAVASDPDARLRKVLDNVLESMLSILSFILDGEPVVECPEYRALCQEHAAKETWFLPGNFVSTLRVQALPTLQRVWESPQLAAAAGTNSQIMASFVGCLGPVLSGQRESQQSSAVDRNVAADVIASGRRVPGLRQHIQDFLDRRRHVPGSQTPIPLPLARARMLTGAAAAAGFEEARRPPEIVPNSAHVDELVALGFSREEAAAALVRTRNNLPRAANELLARGVGSITEASGPGPEAPEAADSAPVATDANIDASEATDAAATDAVVDSSTEQAEPSQSQDAEPMAVDVGSSSAAAAAAAAAEEEGPGAQKGIEPFNQAAWRADREQTEAAQRALLVELRATLRSSIVPRSIEIIDKAGKKAVMTIKGVLDLVICKGESSTTVPLLRDALVAQLDSAAATTTVGVPSADADAAEERLFAHAYLWAVLLSSVAQLDEIYPLAHPLGAPLVRALDAASRHPDRAPKWLTTVLLVVELLLQRDGEPPKAKLESKDEWQRAARRGLTKLPPSTAPVDESLAAPTWSLASEADRISRLFSSPRDVGPSAFEPLASHDDVDEDEDDGGGMEGRDTGSDDEGGASSAAVTAEPVFALSEQLELQRLATAFFAAPVAQYGPAELNALLRLIVILTRRPEFAVAFLDNGGLASVVRALRGMPPGDMPSISAAAAKEKTALGFVNALMSVPKDQQRELRQERVLVMHVLRHVVESKPVLRLQLENLIRDWYQNPQFSSSDIHAYVNSMLVFALRDPELFTQVSVGRNHIPSYNDKMRVHWMVLAWRSRRLLDEEEVDRYEAAPLEETTGESAQAASNAGEGADASGSGEESKPTGKDGEETFKEYLDKKDKLPAYEPYELDAESERLACRVAEFIVEEILHLRPAGTAPVPGSVMRSSTTSGAGSGPISGDARQPQSQSQQPPATPSKTRSASFAVLAPAASSAAASSSLAVPDDSPDTIAYRCFLMQSLSELVSSFPFVLQAIFVARSAPALAPSGLLSPRKGKGKAPAAGADEAPLANQSSLRIRSPLISHLVHDLIVREAVTSTKVPKQKNKIEEAASGSDASALEQVLAIANNQIAIKRGQLSRAVTFCATALLSTLCVRHQEGWTTTAPRVAAAASATASASAGAGPEAGGDGGGDGEITLDSLIGSYTTALSAARQLTLDHIVRAFRECLAAGANDVIYARLTSLAQLTLKLVVVRSISVGRPGTSDLAAVGGSGAQQQQQREGPNILKKMLLERGILDLLTAASSRINLNHPQGREMLNQFLRPIEHLAKAAVKISREAMLLAWEESGQDKMPSAAAGGGRGFNMDLLEDENALIGEDEDIPPDLYENSALGLYQNQRTAAGHDGGEQFDEGDMMEEDFEEEMYDDDNSSVSDIDTEDEDMDEDLLLDESIADDSNADDTADMGVMLGGGGHGADDDEDDDDDDEGDDEDDDDLSDSDDGSISDGPSGDDDESDGESVDTDLELDLDGHAQEVADFLQFDEDRMMERDEREADFYGSDLDGEVVESEDGRAGGGSAGADPDGGWGSELSDAELGMMEAIHHTLTHHSHGHGHNHRHQHLHRNNPRIAAATAAATAGGGAPAGQDGDGGGDEDGSGSSDDDDDDDSSSGSSGSSSEEDAGAGSGEVADLFGDDFPNMMEVTMETIDGDGGPAADHVSGLSMFLMDTIAAAGLAAGRGGGGGGGGPRLNGLPALGHSRPLGGLNGMSGISIGGNPLLVRQGRVADGLALPLPRMPGLASWPRLAGGAGQSMQHPLLDRGDRGDRSDRSSGQQARADRVARNTLSGPLRTTPDDVYGLGHVLATQLSQFHSHGRRPAYTHQMIPGSSSQLEPRAWHEDGGSSAALGFEGMLGKRDSSQGDSSSGGGTDAAAAEAAAAHAVLTQLVRLCRAAAAIDSCMPLGTPERWHEEARMHPRSAPSAYTARIGAPILNSLVPEAMRQSLLRQRYQIERTRRLAEIERRRMEREDAARLAEEAAAAEAAAAAAVEEESKQESEPESEPGSESGPGATGSAGDMAVDEEGGGGEAAGPAEPEAVFVTINGERMDITDTGIDPEFLLALPDDLRMEVIEGRREELRASTRQPTSAPDGISQEFLDALPPEIREEVLEHERIQRQMLERDGALRQPGGASTGAVGSGSGSESGAAGAAASTLDSAVRDRLRIGMAGHAGGWRAAQAAGSDASLEQQRVRDRRRKKIASRDIGVQLVSRGELAALARFVFLPNHALSGPLVSRIMLFVCENARARSQFMQLMLAVLDAGASTLEAVDGVIRHAIAAPADLLCGDPADQGAAGGEPAFALGALHTDVPASMPAQRALEALHALAAHNPRAAYHFLAEQQHAPRLAPLAAAGGESRVPIAHLLALLEKPLFFSQGNAVTELMMQLLSAVSKPIGSVMRRQHQHQNQNQNQNQSQQNADHAGDRQLVPAAIAQLPGSREHSLRAIVNVLAAGECTSRTFQHTLSLIQNMSYMPGVLSLITDELVRRAADLSDRMCDEINRLLRVLREADAPSAEQLDRVRDITLGCFSPAASHQSRLLRLLMAIDYISTSVTRRLDDWRKRRAAEAAETEAAETEAAAAEAISSESVDCPDAAVGMDIDSGSADLDADLAQELLRLRSLSLSQDTHFVPLWEATSQCLQSAAQSPELAHVATVLLPLIESFMVVYKPVLGEKTSAAAPTPGSSLQVSPLAPPSAGEAYFRDFTERHKKILNTLVRNNPGLLSGSFSLLVFNPHVLDFDNKRSYFYQRLHDDTSAGNTAGAAATAAATRGRGLQPQSLQPPAIGGASASGVQGLHTPAGGAGGHHHHHHHHPRPLGHTLQVNVRRETVFEDSYHQFAGQSGDEIKRGRINVKFRDEEGVDAGGVSREWFQALARQMFNPDYALFKPSAAGRVTYQPNPQSWVNPDHLHYFKFVGRIIGKAIVDQRVLDAYFTRSFYKHILGRKVDYRDMEAIDPSYYKSLEWILENDITDVFEETFSIEVDDFGQHRVVDLIPKGHEVSVTEENKTEYVRLVTEQRLYRAIKEQIKSFMVGFHELIPKDLIQIFNEQELELLISGMPDIDVDDWRNNTEYHGGFNSGSAQIQWFWRAVRSFDQEERAKLLQFVTGTSKVPLEGFAHLQGNQGVQKFQIHKDFGAPTRLPTAHTCFNQLDLPLCESFDILRANLLLAISECSTGFGFV
ncbi:E3 ubiquitin-protein ligase tom1 [Coemansia sp. RSA 2320]|nr:E3 ubiquitin-protein ligase tom1 [Coemansia sp. RSA 2320]